MAEVKQYFNRGLDTDTQDFARESGSYINGRNFRFSTTDKESVGGLENIAAMKAISVNLPAGTNFNIGSVEDEGRQRIIYFNYNSEGSHGIYCYDMFLKTVFVVLLSSQVVGGLNFHRFGYIHSASVVGDLLYWVNDQYNEPRAINIEAGIKMNLNSYPTSVQPYQAPLLQSEITLLRRPPMFPASIKKHTLAGPTNFVRDEAFQFCYRYVYRDGEVSVLSMHTRTAGYSTAADTHNAWEVTIPLEEKVPQTVRKIELVVKDLGTNKYSVIKIWDKRKTEDAADIADHNDGTAALSYVFANDQIGIAVSDKDGAKPFESIPIYAESQEVAKNRLFLTNMVRGYTSPQVTSLLSQARQGEQGAAVVGQWYLLTFVSDRNSTQTQYYLEIYNVAQPGFYRPPGYRNVFNPTFPPTIAFNLLTYLGPNVTDVYDDPVIVAPITGGTYDRIVSFDPVDPPVTSQITGTSPVSIIGEKVFKSGASYRLGVLFDDYGDRNWGVVSNDQNKLVTPDRSYGSVAFTRAIDWTLSNQNAAAEIPEKATHYSIVMSKCLRTRFFMQVRAKNMTYVGKNAQGEYTYNTSAWASDLYGVGIDVAGLLSFNFGYQPEEGDVVKIYSGASIFELAVREMQGDWLIVQLDNLGTLNSSTLALVEIYRPIKEQFEEPFYELGARYPIINAGTENRGYSVLKGRIEGDVWLLQRTNRGNYLVEAMSANDKKWKFWNTDHGRIAIKDSIGQQLRERMICHSNVYVDGTAVNGLSNFDALDFIELDIENGPVKRLILTSKIQDEGSVMLAICKFGTSSVYLGEARISDSAGATAFFAKAEGVFGTVNPLKGSYGTSNPESVGRTNDDLVFWIDVNKEAALFYSLNGLTPISDNRATRFFRQFCREYTSLTKEQIEVLGSRPFIPIAIDRHHREILWSLPRTTFDPVRGYLPDYNNFPFPFDVWDGQAKTICYKQTMDYWQVPQTYESEGFCSVGKRLYSFKNGQLWENNCPELGYNNFFGQQNDSMVAFVTNQDPSLVKIWLAIAIECNLVPEFVYFRTESPHIQSSDLASEDFVDFEKIWCAAILRDRLSPNTKGSYVMKMRTGDRMRGPALMTMLKWDGDSLIQLKFSNLTYLDSLGHKV